MLSGGGINSDLATVVTYKHKQTPEKWKSPKVGKSKNPKFVFCEKNFPI